jgi:hypothetical protein
VVEEALMLLDDHTVKAQAMLSSPAARPFIDRIGGWVRKLQAMGEIFDAWLKCQQAWMFLGPVYGSEEIAKHMPKVGGGPAGRAAAALDGWSVGWLLAGGWSGTAPGTSSWCWGLYCCYLCVFEDYAVLELRQIAPSAGAATCVLSVRTCS